MISSFLDESARDLGVGTVGIAIVGEPGKIQVIGVGRTGGCCGRSRGLRVVGRAHTISL